jgi:hypothetical protein
MVGLLEVSLWDFWGLTVGLLEPLWFLHFLPLYVLLTVLY